MLEKGDFGKNFPTHVRLGKPVIFQIVMNSRAAIFAKSASRNLRS
jgi:hypothetical protein